MGPGIGAQLTCSRSTPFPNTLSLCHIPATQLGGFKNDNALSHILCFIYCYFDCFFHFLSWGAQILFVFQWGNEEFRATCPQGVISWQTWIQGLDAVAFFITPSGCFTGVGCRRSTRTKEKLEPQQQKKKRPIRKISFLRAFVGV